MSIEDAFLEGLRLARAALKEAGCSDENNLKGTDIQVLAAQRVFNKKSKGLEHHPDFKSQAPIFAKTLILAAYAGR